MCSPNSVQSRNNLKGTQNIPISAEVSAEPLKRILNEYKRLKPEPFSSK